MTTDLTVNQKPDVSDVYDPSLFTHKLPPYLTLPEDREKFEQLRQWENYILSHRARELGDRYAQVYGIWQVYQHRLYRVLKDSEWGSRQSGENAIDEEDETFYSFLDDLRVNGVEVAARSTWHEKATIIKAGLTEGKPLEDAIRMSITASGAIEKLIRHGVLEIERTQEPFKRVEVKLKRGVNADRVLGDTSVSEYMDVMKDTQSTKDAMRIVNHDLGVSSTSVTNLQEVQSIKDIPDEGWQYFWGEVMIASPQGNTPYQFYIALPRDMENGAKTQFLAKVSKRYSHLGRTGRK